MIFSDFSVFVILFFVSSPFWHMAVISIAAGHHPAKTATLLSVVAVWITWVWFAVLTEFDANWFGVFQPARPLFYLIIPAALAYRFRYLILGNGVSQHLLIGLQLIRPIGMIFVFEYFRGTLPGMFAHPAGWGDLLAGSVAAYVLWRFYKGSIPRGWVYLVAVIGLLDFASAFFFGFTSSANPIQLFAFDNPNQVIRYPLGLIPMLLVPYAVIAHILSLTQLRLCGN